jgi:hypothetical protein
MLVYMGACAAYLYFTLATFKKHTVSIIFSHTLLLFKVLSMSAGIFIPWILGRAACRLGPLALPSDLTLSKREVAAEVAPSVILILGLVGIHSHAVSVRPLGAVPITLCACLGGLGHLAFVVVFHAWMQDVLQETKVVGDKKAVTAAEAAAVLDRFEQLKAAVSSGLFILLVFSQLIQIFSAYNTVAGENTLIK